MGSQFQRDERLCWQSRDMADGAGSSVDGVEVFSHNEEAESKLEMARVFEFSKLTPNDVLPPTKPLPS